MARPPMKPLERDMSNSVVSIGGPEIEEEIWWGFSRLFGRALTEI